MAWQSDVTWNDVRRDLDDGKAYRATVNIEHGKPISYSADYGVPADEIDALHRECDRLRGEALRWQALWLRQRARS